MDKIVIIGGTGLLGKGLNKLDYTLYCLDSSYDIYSFNNLSLFLDKTNTDIIVNLAAIISEKVDNDPENAINVNIIGAANVAKCCIQRKKRLVYVSTDYVYPGVTGNYKETDSLYPQNKYAWTKLAGEASSIMVPNHLIIRTSFGPDKFPYDKAYSNLFTSKDYVDTIAPMILSAIKSTLTGIVNIGTQRKSLYEYANIKNNVTAYTIPITKDFSLNTEIFDIHCP